MQVAGAMWHRVTPRRVFQFLLEQHVWSICYCSLWFIGWRSLGWSHSTWPAKAQVIYQATSCCLLKCIKCFVLGLPSVSIFRDVDRTLNKERRKRKEREKQRFYENHYPCLPDHLWIKKKAVGSNNEHDVFLPWPSCLEHVKWKNTSNVTLKMAFTY